MLQPRDVEPQPWGTCHAHVLLPQWRWHLHNPRVLPSRRIRPRPASLACFAVFIGAELFLPSSSLHLSLLFFFFFPPQVSVVVPATLERVSRHCCCYLTAGHIDGAGSGFAVVVSRRMEVNRWAGCVLLGSGGCKRTELSPLCHSDVAAYSLRKGSSCHVQPWETSGVSSASFSVLQNGRKPLCFPVICLIRLSAVAKTLPEFS